MMVVVYQTRYRGRPVTPLDALARPARGRLSFAQEPRDVYAPGVMICRLLDPKSPEVDVLPRIEHAQVERLRDWAHIRGI